MSDESIEELIAKLSSEAPLVRREAARALGALEAKAAVSALVEALRRPVPDGLEADNPEHTSRAAAAVALGLIGDPSAAGALLEAIADPFNLGTAASTALGRLKPPPVEALVEALSDANPWRRARAVAALGEIGDTAHFESMARLLADPEDAVRRAAASAFEKLRDPRAVAPLVALISDATVSDFVRSYAAMALGALKDAAAVDALLAATESSDALLRRSAARALCRIGNAKADGRLRELADTDPDKSVRQVVLRYLEPREGQREH